jgi:hypothetical protein
VYCDVVDKLTVAVVTPVGVNALGEGAHPDADAPPIWQVKEIGDEKPATGVRVAVVLVESPAITVPVVGLMLSVKSTPLPISAAVNPE